MIDDNEEGVTHGPVSSEDHGFGSSTWLLMAALHAASHRLLLAGICDMVRYLDTHARHAEDPEIECEGPDLWTAFDILVQTALTGEYVETIDPEDPEYVKALEEYERKKREIPEDVIEDEVKRFRDILNRATEPDENHNTKGASDGDAGKAD